MDVKLAPVVAKVEQIEKRLDGHDQRMDRFENQLKVIQESGSAQASSVHEDQATVGNRFTPSYLDIKIVCD